jgi:NAD(P)-dependent dehydrogenase (short-subunit alcohol dehydrogenase family)
MASPRWTAASLPDQSGRTVVVTGASSGIGTITARELARAGARVVLAVRDTAKGDRVAAGMPGDPEVRRLDLASLASVRAFAAGWTGPIDVLINNAGIMAVPAGRMADGFERQIGTNHLGPFLLTSLLLPAITDRIVTVSSQLHRRARLDTGDLNWEHRRYRANTAYSDSKLANLLFTAELQARLSAVGRPVRAIAAQPGIARTSLTAEAGGGAAAFDRYLGWFFNDAERGALPTLYAATQDVPGGSYVGPDGLGHLRGYPEVQEPSGAARDRAAARRLWDLSARLTGVAELSGAGAG